MLLNFNTRGPKYSGPINFIKMISSGISAVTPLNFNGTILIGTFSKFRRNSHFNFKRNLRCPYKYTSDSNKLPSNRYCW